MLSFMGLINPVFVFTFTNLIIPSAYLVRSTHNPRSLTHSNRPSHSTDSVDLLALWGICSFYVESVHHVRPAHSAHPSIPAPSMGRDLLTVCMEIHRAQRGAQSCSASRKSQSLTSPNQSRPPRPTTQRVDFNSPCN